LILWRKQAIALTSTNYRTAKYISGVYRIIASTRILGIDPGTATVGYGALLYSDGEQYEYIDAGIIQTSKELPAGDRLAIIRTDIISLIEQFTPDVLAIEALFFFKNAKTVISVAQARGVILEAASGKNLPVAEYTPMQVKLNLTGFGRADKQLVQIMIAQLLGLPQIIKPDDASDALALAVCHARLGMAQARSLSHLVTKKAV
jgi:crossover junction endodeoxyribonuclease RuvC